MSLRAGPVALLGALLLLTAGPRSAAAQTGGGARPAPPAEASAAEEGAEGIELASVDPREEEARALFERGRELAGARRFSEATEAFSQSLMLVERPSTLFNLAVTLFALGRYVETIASLEQYIAHLAPEAEAEGDDRADAERMLQHARSSVAEITLELLPASATVTVDGRALEGGGLRSVRVNEGTHVVRVEAEDHAPALFEMAAHPREHIRRAVQLESTRLPAQLTVEVSDPPGASISVDGRSVGTGQARLELDAGTHTLHVTHPEIVSLERTLSLAWNERLQVVIAAPTRASGPGLHEEPAFWGTVLGLAAAAAVGVVVGVLVSEEPQPHGGTTGIVLTPATGATPGPG